MKHIRIWLSSLAVLMLTMLPVNAASGYSDVADNDWFVDAAIFCRDRGLMMGTGDSAFSPEAPVTLASAATVLWRSVGAPSIVAAGNLSDVQPSAWYEAAAYWAVENDLVDASAGFFGVNEALSTEQLLSLFWKLQCAIDADAAAAGAAEWAKAAGVIDESILSHTSGGRASRAQLAVMLMNYVVHKEGAVAVDGKMRGFTEFDAALIDFLDDAGFSQENYMVSPTSFRAALALAVSGADTETKTQLMRAMGFESMDDVNQWYDSVRGSIDAFASDLNAAKELYTLQKDFYPEGTAAPDRAFSIANSVWHNADKQGTMSPDYVSYVAEHYDATAAEAAGAKLTGMVNDWVTEKTNGLIPSIADDLSQTDAVLINALYLRTSWTHTFSDWATSPGDFTTAAGTVVTKDFMQQQDKFYYYEDASSKLLVMPMAGGIKAAFVLGEAGNLNTMLSNAKYEEVIVKLPKFEIETSLSNRELVRFLMARGATLPFSSVPGEPDFSLMSADSEWFISDIIQKSKIKVDEDGIEAAAVTAIMMGTTSALIEEPPQPKEFIADHPFSFYLYTGESDAPELLFYGQLVQ